MKKKMIALTMVMILAMGMLSGCGLGAQTSTPSAPSSGGAASPANPAPSTENTPDGAVTIKMGGSVAETHPITQGQYYFEQILEERSNGMIQVEIYPNCQLGAPRELIEQVMNGTLQMCESGVAALSSFSDKLDWTALPFMFPTRDIVFDFVDGEVGKAMNERIREELGIIMPTYYENGYYSLINSKKVITSPDDMRGMKLRVQENDVYLEVYKKFGSNPLPMSMTEAFTGLQQGTIDGMQTNFVLTETGKYYEIARNFTDLKVFYDLTGIYINEDFYNTLPEDLQGLLIECIVESAEYQRELADRAVDGSIAFLQDGKKMDIYFLSDEERQVFIDMAGPVYSWFINQKNEPHLEEYFAEINRLCELHGVTPNYDFGSFF